MANDREPGSSEMVDRAPEEGTEPLSARVISYVFVAFLLGSGFLLGAGGSPYWIEIFAAAFLWFVVLLFLFCLSAGLLISLFPHPVPETQQAPPNTVQNRSPWRKLRRYSFRLLYLFFVGALFVSGRPILAVLYIGLPAMVAVISVRMEPQFTGQANPLKVGPVGRFLYDAIRFAGQAIKWCCWTAPWAAIALCLLLADIRIKPSLRKAVGFPRPIAYLLYAKRYGYFWREVLPLGFWSVCAILGLALAAPILPTMAAELVTSALGTMALVLLGLALLSFIVLVFAEDDGHVIQRPPLATWPRKVSPYLLTLLRLVYLTTLCVAGEWLLAGLYLTVICVMAAVRWYRYRDTLEGEGAVWHPLQLIRASAGMIAVVILFSPIVVPYLAYEHLSDRRTARLLRETFERPDGLVYFVFSEPHQRKHFLGAEGLLGRLGDRVVVRDWREDICPVRDGPRESDFLSSPEGRLLRRFEIARLREHLPFVALVGPGNRLKPFHLSEAYRARRRDGGGALKEIEGQIRVALAKAFAAPA